MVDWEEYNRLVNVIADVQPRRRREGKKQRSDLESLSSASLSSFALSWIHDEWRTRVVDALCHEAERAFARALLSSSATAEQEAASLSALSGDEHTVATDVRMALGFKLDGVPWGNLGVPWGSWRSSIWN